MIREIKTKQDSSNIAATEFLEGVLERARKGEILAVGICAVLTEGRIYEGGAGGRDTAALLGASLLMQDTIKSWFEDE